jgi:hypothetical protein
MVIAALRQSSRDEEGDQARAPEIEANDVWNKISLKAKLCSQHLREFGGMLGLFGCPKITRIDPSRSPAA